MEWEGLSMDMVEWNIVINNFEKLVGVEKLLNMRTKSFTILADDELKVSVKLLLDKGRGQ